VPDCDYVPSDGDQGRGIWPGDGRCLSACPVLGGRRIEYRQRQNHLTSSLNFITNRPVMNSYLNHCYNSMMGDE
jgi:hypothetical protein